MTGAPLPQEDHGGVEPLNLAPVYHILH